MLFSHNHALWSSFGEIVCNANEFCAFLGNTIRICRILGLV